MLVTIVNFKKYNPRNDVKNASWVRLQRNWWVDMFGWPLEATAIWFMLLGLAKFETGEVEVVEGFIEVNLRLSEAQVSSAIRFLLSKCRITLREVTNTRPGSYNPDPVSAPVVTDGRTDGTNGRTDEHVGGVLNNLDSPSMLINASAPAPARVDPPLDEEAARLEARRILAKALGAPSRAASEDEEAIWDEAGALARRIITTRYQDFRSFWNAYILARQGASQTIVDAQFREEFTALLMEGR